MTGIDSVHTSEDQATAPQRRLLRHLAQEGAFAVLSSLCETELSLYRSRGAMTLGAGVARIAVASELVAQGRACWQGKGAGRRLVAADPAKAAPDAATSSRNAAGQQRLLGHARVIMDGQAADVVVNMLESPLAWLHRRKDRHGRPQISAAAFAAGERFRADVTLAQMLPRITSNWSAPLASGRRGPADDPASASEAVLSARQRVRRACDILGPESSGLVLDVCAFLKRLELVEIERGWPVRSAKLALRLALDRLADHYGLGERVSGAGRQPARFWQATDARPTRMPGL